jgi:hypothetical protein
MPTAKNQGPIRPKFTPNFPDPACALAQTDDPAWISVIESDAYFSLDSVSRRTSSHYTRVSSESTVLVN